MVCQPAVVLLRHRRVEAAQPRFQMADGDIELHGRERRCQRRVDISRDDDQIGPQFHEQSFELDHRSRRLLGVRSRSDRELVVRRRKRQLGEEDIVDLAVVVLARVNQALLDVPEPLELRVDGRDLHVVRTRTDHVHHELTPHNHPSNC